MTLTDIIEALEKATGPDRELDARIAALVEPHLFDAPGFASERPIPAFRYGRSENVIRFEGGGIMDMRFFHHVTASVDAAIALAERVLPGWDWGVKSFGEDGAHSKVWKHGWHDDTVVGANHSYPAIALCIAILSALQAKEGTKP